MRGRLCEPERCRFEVALNIHNYVIFNNYSEILINNLFIVKDFSESLTDNCSGRATNPSVYQHIVGEVKTYL